MSEFDLAQRGGPTVQDDQAGWGVLAATGYEWRVAEEVALGPQVEFAYIDVAGNITNNVNYFSITAQLTWYP